MTELSIPGLYRFREDIYLYKSSCNIWIFVRDGKALLINSGTGLPDEVLENLGIEKIDCILHNHLDRALSAASPEYAAEGVEIHVPASQAYLLEDADVVWENHDQYHSYNFKPGFTIPLRSFETFHKVFPGSVIKWKDLEFSVVATVGDDDSVAYSLELDDEKLLFSGDLIAGEGTIWNFYDLERWYNEYYMGERTLMDRAMERLDEILSLNPDFICPARGEKLMDGSAGVADVLTTMRSLKSHLYADTITSEIEPPTHERDFSSHGLYNIETSWFLVAPSGKVLVFDFGWPILPGDDRDILTRLKKQAKRDDLTPDLLLVGHYHDDHIGGIPSLQRNYPDLEVAVYEGMADILQNPMKWNLPCLGTAGYPTGGFPVDRFLSDGEELYWEGHLLKIFHFPGQTEQHMALVIELDGETILFAGDSVYRPGKGFILRGESSNGPNRCALGEGMGYRKCADVLKDVIPSYLASAHHGLIPVVSGQFDEYASWAEKTEEIMSGLIEGRQVNFGTDPLWCHFYPFRQVAEPGEILEVELVVRNYESHDCMMRSELKLPAGWGSSSLVGERTVKAGKEIRIPYKVTVGADAGNRMAVSADILFDGIFYGELPVFLVDSPFFEDSAVERVYNKYKHAMADSDEKELCYLGAWLIPWE